MSTVIKKIINGYDSAAAGLNPHESNMTAFERLRLGWSNSWLLNFPIEADQENDWEYYDLPRRLTDSSYGREEFDVALDALSAGAPSVEDVWKITQKIPFDLSKLLSDDRNKE